MNFKPDMREMCDMREMRDMSDMPDMRLEGPRTSRGDARATGLEAPAPLAFSTRDRRRRFNRLSRVVRCASASASASAVALATAAIALALSGCGGSDAAPAAPSTAVAADARPADAMRAADARVPPLGTRPEPVRAEPASQARASNRSLREALAVLEADGIVVTVDPSIAGAAIAGDIPRGIKGDDLVASLRGFDVVLLYGGGGARSGSTLKAVWVHPPGRAGEPTAAPGTDVSQLDERHQPLLTQQTARPELLERDLASPDPALRRQALVTSFALQTALSENALLQTTRADPEGDLRRVALQALARHPSADETVVRAAVQAALGDRDADVRSVAQQLLEQLDLTALPAESVPPPTASP